MIALRLATPAEDDPEHRLHITVSRDDEGPAIASRPRYALAQRAAKALGGRLETPTPGSLRLSLAQPSTSEA